MLTRTLSGNSFNQVKSVMKDLVHTVAKKKTVSWHPSGITRAMTFEIEPWRRIRPTPPTNIRCSDNDVPVAPFTLPYAPMMKPLADYSDYVTPMPPAPAPPTGFAPLNARPMPLNARPMPLNARATSMRCDLESLKVSPLPNMVLECMLWSNNAVNNDDDDDDDDDDKKPPPASSALARSRPVSLAEVYAIVESMDKVDKFMDASTYSDRSTYSDDDLYEELYA